MSLHFEPVDDIIRTKLNTIFPHPDTFIISKPFDIILPSAYPYISEKIKTFTVRKEDIWLISYPRSGSTWLQEMVWLLGNNLDYEKTKELQQIRSPLLELSAVLANDHQSFLMLSEFYFKFCICLTSKANCNNMYPIIFKFNFRENIGDSVDFIDNRPSPRYIKTHIDLDMLPKQINEVKPKVC